MSNNKVQEFIVSCLEDGIEGTFEEMIATREREMRNKGYVKNKEGFWVEPETKVIPLGK